MAKRNEEVREFIRNNPPDGSDGYCVAIAKRFKMNPGSISRIVTNMGFSAQPKTAGEEMPKIGVDQLESLVSKLLLTRTKKWSVAELSTHFDVGVGRIVDVIERMRARGKNIELRDSVVEISKEIPRAKPTVIDTTKFAAKHFQFGLTADNHLGSKYERLDVLNALFDIWAAQGVTTVFQCGNMIEGERHSKFDIHQYGMQNQADYFVENWPKRDGITTKFISADDHEGWYVQDEGVNIGQFIEMTARAAGRTDLQYLGHMEHDIVLRAERGHAVMRLIHAGGGSSYATSYAVQKIVESYQGGEKPNILLVGH